jgi:hypothetical protein
MGAERHLGDRAGIHVAAFFGPTIGVDHAHIMPASSARRDANRKGAPIRQYVLAEQVAPPIRIRDGGDIDLPDRLPAAIQQVEGGIALRRGKARQQAKHSQEGSDKDGARAHLGASPGQYDGAGCSVGRKIGMGQ